MYLENQVDVKKHRQGGAGKGGGFLCVKAVLVMAALHFALLLPVPSFHLLQIAP